jgi:hypothetical protein
MKAWQLDRLGGTLALRDVATPEPRPGTVLVQIEASPLLSCFKAYAEGRLRTYSAAACVYPEHQRHRNRRRGGTRRLAPFTFP